MTATAISAAKTATIAVQSRTNCDGVRYCSPGEERYGIVTIRCLSMTPCEIAAATDATVEHFSRRNTTGANHARQSEGHRVPFQPLRPDRLCRDRRLFDNLQALALLTSFHAFAETGVLSFRLASSRFLTPVQLLVVAERQIDFREMTSCQLSVALRPCRDGVL